MHYLSPGPDGPRHAPDFQNLHRGKRRPTLNFKTASSLRSAARGAAIIATPFLARLAAPKPLSRDRGEKG